MVNILAQPQSIFTQCQTAINLLTQLREQLAQQIKQPYDDYASQKDDLIQRINEAASFIYNSIVENEILTSADAYESAIRTYSTLQSSLEQFKNKRSVTFKDSCIENVCLSLRQLNRQTVYSVAYRFYSQPLTTIENLQQFDQMHTSSYVEFLSKEEYEPSTFMEGVCNGSLRAFERRLPEHNKSFCLDKLVYLLEKVDSPSYVKNIFSSKAFTTSTNEEELEKLATANPASIKLGLSEFPLKDKTDTPEARARKTCVKHCEALLAEQKKHVELCFSVPAVSDLVLIFLGHFPKYTKREIRNLS